MGNNGKIERIEEEEDKNSENGYNSNDDMGDGKGGRQMKRSGAGKQKKNFLLKNILDQTKELCFEHASQYKDFESVYNKILMRF